MPKEPVDTDELRERFRLQPRGVATWMTRDEIDRSRRRWTWVLIVSVLVALLWVMGFFSEDRGEDFLSGFLMLEFFTGIPLVYSLFRLRRLRRLGRATALPPEAQLADLEEEQIIDESLHRITGLVDRLPSEARSAHGSEALHAARRTTAEWRKLVRRAGDLRALHRSSSGPAKTKLQFRLDRTEDDIAQLRTDMDRLAVSLADLADATDDHDLAEVAARIEAAEERMLLFVEALEELRSSDPVER